MQKINEAYGKIRDAASRAQTNTELNRKNEDKAKPAEPKNTNNNQNQPPPAQPKNANSNNQNQPPAQPSSNYSAPSGDYNPRPWNYSPPPPGYYYSYPPWNYPPPPPSFYYPYPSSPSNNYYAQTGIYNPTSWSYPPPAQGHYSSNPPPIQINYFPNETEDIARSCLLTVTFFLCVFVFILGFWIIIAIQLHLIFAVVGGSFLAILFYVLARKVIWEITS